jgi:uncharacterized phage protein (TIGR02218 family)
MAFDDDEKSISDSAPVELYTFTTNGAVYRRTSYDANVIHDGNTYVAVPMMRTSVVVGGADQAEEIFISMPVSDLVVRNHLASMPRLFELEIRRKQLVSGETRVLWQGVVTSITASGLDGKLRSPGLRDDPLAAPVPSAYFQSMCNHVLYDPRCGKLRTAFQVVTSVTSISGRNVTVATVDGKPDTFFPGGDILRSVDSDRRMIKAQAGNILTLDAPFPPTVALPYTVTLFAGCDHSITTCKTKFDNVLNFGGHPYISTAYVFASRLIEIVRR